MPSILFEPLANEYLKVKPLFIMESKKNLKTVDLSNWVGKIFIGNRKHIDIIQQTMIANRRISIIETMGRHCGLIALHSATAGNASIVVTSEKPKTEEELEELIKKQVKRGNLAPCVVVAEKLFDVNALARRLEKNLGIEARGIVIGYIQRGGSPTVSDRILAMRYAVESVTNAIAKKFGFVLGLRADKIIKESLNNFKNFSPNFEEELFEQFCARKKI